MALVTGELGQAHYALTDRAGGTSAAPYDSLNLGTHVGDEPLQVAANRRALLRSLPGAAQLSVTDQVHGADVAVVRAGDNDGLAAGGPPQADAQVSADHGVALAVLTADCVPVLLATTRGRPVVGVAHAGRLGVQHGVVAAAVAAMTRLGADAPGITALVGPAICARCYEVPPDMRDQVASVVPSARATARAGTPALDLPAAVVAQLHDAGVTDVRRDDRCTAEVPSLFSHRRDGVTGRQAGVVWLPA